MATNIEKHHVYVYLENCYWTPLAGLLPVLDVDRHGLSHHTVQRKRLLRLRRRRRHLGTRRRMGESGKVVNLGGEIESRLLM